MKKKIVVGITGASGAIYGKMLLDKLVTLQEQIADCGVILSKNARDVWKYEIGEPELSSVPFTLYEPGDFFAPMASGSAGYDAMIIIPCTMGTLGRIASGVSSDLMTRSADVILKERKTLILVPREMPYNLIHLENMKLLTAAGAIICPASPSFYNKPGSIDDLVMTVVDRVLKLSGFEFRSFEWGK
jgi:4-hydroxy-3-polyprenylbenzoate decarboxylase